MAKATDLLSCCGARSYSWTISDQSTAEQTQRWKEDKQRRYDWVQSMVPHSDFVLSV